MNKSGFTLIEILCTITIISLIATMASFNLLNFVNNKKELYEQSQENIITTAALVYIELAPNKPLKDTCLSQGCTITTDTLITAGLLEKDDVDKLEVINITKENNEIKCTIK